jgi:hypothetical protein
MTGYVPALGVATGLFELGVAASALRGRGDPRLLRPVALLLVLLAGYQFLEVLACGTPASAWPARWAFVDIVWLPPLGVWLIVQLAESTPPLARAAARQLFYAAGALSAWVLVDPSFVTRTVCNVVLARYEHGTPLYVMYGGFYQAGLGAMMLGASAALAITDDPRRRRHLADVQMGTIAFVVPSLLTELLLPGTAGAMPSVMCHYALILAVFLARLVAREQHASALDDVSYRAGT